MVFSGFIFGLLYIRAQEILIYVQPSVKAVLSFSAIICVLPKVNIYKLPGYAWHASDSFSFIYTFNVFKCSVKVVLIFYTKALKRRALPNTKEVLK